jgi:hypothetical protein
MYAIISIPFSNVPNFGVGFEKKKSINGCVSYPVFSIHPLFDFLLKTDWFKISAFKERAETLLPRLQKQTAATLASRRSDYHFGTQNQQ